MADEQRPSQKAVVAISAAAAVTAAVAGVLTYIFVMRRLAGSPDHILNRCQDAISRIEHDISATGR